MGYPFYFPVMNNPAKRLTKTCLLAAHQKKRAVDRNWKALWPDGTPADGR
jgi:hypothetical protein